MRQGNRKKVDIRVYAGSYMGGMLYSEDCYAPNKSKLRVKPARAVGKLLMAIPAAIAALFSAVHGLLKKPGLTHGNKSSISVFDLPSEYIYSYSASVSKKRRIAFDGKKISVAAVLLICIGVGLAAPVIWPSRAVAITLNDNGYTVSAKTTSDSVGEFIKNAGISLESGDMIIIPEDTPIYAGMEIPIKRAGTVTIVAGGEVDTVKMASGTVQDALDMAGIAAKPDDSVTPYMNTPVEPGMTIMYSAVTTELIKEEQPIENQLIETKTDSLLIGDSKVAVEGRDGIKAVTYLVTYEDGIEMKRSVVDQEIVLSPINREILIGIAEPTPEPVETPTPSSGGSSSTSKSSSSSSSSKSKSSSSSSSSKPKSGSSSSSSSKIDTSKLPSSISADDVKKTLKVTVTAYSWDAGNITSLGKRPSVGTIAVDPKVIPYGTKIYVPGYGIGYAADTGGFIKKNSMAIDVFMDTYAETRAWGRKKNVTIYLLK